MEKKEIADVKYVTYFIKWLITSDNEVVMKEKKQKNSHRMCSTSYTEKWKM